MDKESLKDTWRERCSRINYAIYIKGTDGLSMYDGLFLTFGI